MFTSSRTQDYAAIVLGVIALLSPIWVDTDGAARWSLIVLGVLTALSGLAQEFPPAKGSMTDTAMGVFGVLMFISPWVMGFHSYGGAAWTAWIIGVLTVVAALASLPAMNDRMHHSGLATHH